MRTIAKGVSMFLLSIVIMALLITTALGFMLGLSHPLPWILILLLIIIPYLHEKILSHQRIRWQADMSTGISLIDDDHKILIWLINQLQKATQYKMEESEIESVMQKLLNYTRYHFDREEFLMRNNHYPDYDNHKKLHEEMIASMTDCMEKYQSDPEHSIEEALAFLKNWLVNHIRGNDQDYVPYINNTDLSGHEQLIQ